MFALTVTWDWSLFFEIVAGAFVALELSKHLP